MRAALLLVLLCLLPGQVYAVPNDLHLFILAGQSNMTGQGKVSELPEDFPRHKNRIWNFTNAYLWQRAKEPIDSPFYQVDQVSRDDCAGVGPGLSFADRLADLQPGIQIGLIPCAKGGSTIDQWRPARGRDTLYGSCLARARLAAHKGTIRGILWYQGESDTYSPEAVLSWPVKFKILIEYFRRDLKIQDLPVVFVQIGKLAGVYKNQARFRYWKNMQREQGRLKLKYSRMVKADHLPVSDGIHLTTKGYLELGRKLAEAMNVLAY